MGSPCTKALELAGLPVLPRRKAERGPVRCPNPQRWDRSGQGANQSQHLAPRCAGCQPLTAREEAGTAANRQTQEAPAPQEAMRSTEQGMAPPPNPRRITMELAREQLWRALYSQRQLQEVMVQFWMNHFNIFAGKGADRWLLTSFERDAIRAVLKTILTSPEFSSQAAFRAKVKSPFELVASSLRALGGETDGGAPLLGAMVRMGQPLFYYQAPTGFLDRASTWINSGRRSDRRFGADCSAIPRGEAGYKARLGRSWRALYNCSF